MWRLLPVLLLAFANADAQTLFRPGTSTCSRPCPYSFQPVCAVCPRRGETTFVNDCEFGRQNACYKHDQCIKLHNGPCGEIGGNPPCDIVCLAVYQPICALCEDGAETTFGNDCELDRQNTCNSSNQCSKLHEGKCGTCNIACPLNYAPVCAVCADGSEKTFGNGCELGRQNTCNQNNRCTKLRDGECGDTRNPPCGIACAKIYQPVCALCDSGAETTFGNDCELDRQNTCNSSNQCTKLRDGECEDTRDLPCDITCQEIYQPVCALCDNGAETTFGNDCELDRQNTCNSSNQCTKLRDGECGDTGNPPCDIVCLAVFQPVCALCDNGAETTFGNDCELDRQNTCNSSIQCTKLYDGQCGDTRNPPCDIACLAIYQPVCALCDNGAETTFGNDCELDRQNTCNSSIQCTKIRDGECSPASTCHADCPLIYQPVCAVCADGSEQTFENGCELDRQNSCNPQNQCTVLQEGECGELNPRSRICPGGCPKIYNPVCAQCPNGKQTFSNACILARHNCQTQADCIYLQDGNCEERCSLVDCPYHDVEVCAVCNDDKFRSFPNTCLMDNYNCKNNGNCRNISQGIGKRCPPLDQFYPSPVVPEPRTSSCDRIFCPDIYRPVCARCGRTARTFGNSCALRVYNCENNNECVTVQDGECPSNCSNGRDPICATCSHGPRTFKNDCVFEMYNILNPQDNCRKRAHGQCPSNCPAMACLNVQNPICAICGTEERTFDNECSFTSYNCRAGYECSKLRDGQCEEVDPTGTICPAACTREYQPVCAQCRNRQQTFNNYCLLQQNNCQSRGGCTYLRDGQCAPKSCIRSCPASHNAQVCAVCAKNKFLSFHSECTMEIHNCRTNDNCQIVSQGSRSCPPAYTVGPVVPRTTIPTDTSQCAAILCSALRRPVCAQCGQNRTLKTFENECLLDVHNCFNNQECTKLSEGTCQQTPTPIICSIHRDPVCASCSTGPKTFQNECFFNSYRILKPEENCVKRHAGKCQTICPLYNCLFVQRPICALCGFEQRTFQNECFFKSYNCPAGFECTKIKDGPCSSVPPPLICTGEYRPVCASCSYGLETFANKCFLNAQNVANPQANCVQKKEGSCAVTCPQVKCSSQGPSVCGLCGNQERTFINECIFNTDNCNSGYACRILHPGDCK